MDKPVVIIHFKPLELYPPVMNLISFLAGVQRGRIIVFTTRFNLPLPKLFAISSSHIRIRRMGVAGNNMQSLVRYVQYLKFYAGCFFQLLFIRPDKILYVETISVYPAYLYKRYINRNAEIMVHYHEYTAPVEYQQSGMKLTRYFHRRERWLYPRLSWISHTNEDRLLRFINDEGLTRTAASHIMPNYPGKSWAVKTKERQAGPVRIVYAGAVSRKTMHFETFVNWVLRMEGYFTFDIYGFNINEEDRNWLQQISQPYISLHERIDYDALPSVISRYDIGVILYNGHIPNYIINAPNKLFEYLACGLDVWAAQEITGCQPYYTENKWPKVLPVNFQSLNNFDYTAALNREGLIYKEPAWYFEQVYPEIAEKLLGTTVA